MTRTSDKNEISLSEWTIYFDAELLAAGALAGIAGVIHRRAYALGLLHRLQIDKATSSHSTSLVSIRLNGYHRADLVPASEQPLALEYLISGGA